MDLVHQNMSEKDKIGFGLDYIILRQKPKKCIFCKNDAYICVGKHKYQLNYLCDNCINEETRSCDKGIKHNFFAQKYSTNPVCMMHGRFFTGYSVHSHIFDSYKQFTGYVDRRCHRLDTQWDVYHNLKSFVQSYYHVNGDINRSMIYPYANTEVYNINTLDIIIKIMFLKIIIQPDLYSKVLKYMLLQV